MLNLKLNNTIKSQIYVATKALGITTRRGGWRLSPLKLCSSSPENSHFIQFEYTNNI